MGEKEGELRSRKIQGENGIKVGSYKAGRVGCMKKEIKRARKVTLTVQSSLAGMK